MKQRLVMHWFRLTASVGAIVAAIATPAIVLSATTSSAQAVPPMRRLLPLAIATLAIALVATAPATAHPGSTPPPHSHAFGVSLVDWQKRWMAWAFGSSTNPLGKPTCGERVKRAFFLNATTDPGTTEFDCNLKPGTPLIGTAGGAINWINPEDAPTPRALLASIRADFEPGVLSDPRATLDGRSLGDLGPTLRLTDIYTIPLEPGNYIQTVDPDNPAVAGDHTRVASGGWFVRLTPLRPGKHTLVLSDRIGGDLFQTVFHITVGHGGHCHGSS